MSSTVAEADPGPPPADGLPKIPGYQLTRLLGRGGMGCVYLARDVRLNREVAVKTLAVDDPDLAARFQEEVTAVAAVRHPNVLHVYQAGEFDGRPYFVMEYVAGGTLSAELAGKPMAPRAAAALLEPVARAVHHCHGLGILHRDLKPGNILLSNATGGVRAADVETLPADGGTRADHAVARTPSGALIPKVADFGLAKRLYADAKLTRTGEVLGTPAYMAPEQASGVVTQLGPAADIYSLGAILYEMLTGRPPFQSPDPVQTLMMVLSMDPIPPRQLQPAIPRDLDTICLRCLQKSPKRRYASAADLADDLGRFLDGRPIAARPIRVWEKAVKWARRRPAAAGLVAAGVAGVIALAVGVVGFGKKNAELRAANQQLGEANERRAAMLGVSLEAVNRMLIQFSHELGAVPHAEAARHRVLKDAERLCLLVRADSPYDLNGRHLIATARYHLAEVYRLQGREAEAMAEAVVARDALVGVAAEAADRADFQASAVAARNRVGQMLAEGGDVAGAEVEYRAALEVGSALDPTSETFRQALGRVRNNLALVYGKTGRPALAEAEHRRLLAGRLAALADDPADPERQRDVAATRSNLGNLALQAQEYDRALAELTAAESAYRAMVGPIPADRDNLGKVLLNLVTAAAKRQQPDLQGRAAQSAAETFAGLAAEFSGVPEYRYRHAYARMQVAFWHSANGRSPQGVEHMAAARTILVSLTKEFPDNAEYRTRLALCRQLLGEQ